MIRIEFVRQTMVEFNYKIIKRQTIKIIIVNFDNECMSNLDRQ